MSATLVSLPAELIELINHYIELPDVGNLRLTCQTISAKASSGTFKRLFHRSRPILLHEKPLRTFRSITSRGLISSWMTDHLRIAGVAKLDEPLLTTDEVDARIAVYRALLAEALDRLAAHQPSLGVRKLSVVLYVQSEDTLRMYKKPAGLLHLAPKRVILQRQPAAQSVCQASKLTSRIVMAALQASKLPLDELEFMPKPSSRPGVLCSAIPPTLAQNFANCLGSAKKLVVHFLREDDLVCVHIERVRGRLRQQQRPDDAPVRTAAIVNFLRQCPNIEELTTSYTSSCSPQLRPQIATELLPPLTSTVNWSHLMTLNFQGLHTTQEALQAFLCGLPSLRRLILDLVTITDGGWQTVLSTVCNDDRSLQCLIIRDILEGGQVLRWDGARLQSPGGVRRRHSRLYKPVIAKRTKGQNLVLYFDQESAPRCVIRDWAIESC